MLGVYTIVQAGEHGWGSLHTLGLGAVSLALLGGFVARQATAATPLLPLRLLRSRPVAGANAAQVLMVGGLFGVFFLGVLYLQRVLGYDAIEIGLAFLPVSLGIGILSLGFSARLVMRFGPRAVLLAGLASIAGGLALFSQVPVDGRYVTDVLPAMLLIGAGGGLSFPALMALAMTGATAEDSGLLSGLVNTTQQVGAALGPGGAGHAGDVAQRQPARRRRRPGRRAHRRLHARVRRRRRLPRRRLRDRGRRAAAAVRGGRARAARSSPTRRPRRSRGPGRASCRACPSGRSWRSP